MTRSSSPTSSYEPDADDALYDPLTGLPGRLLQRAHLVHALRRATRTGTQVAVLFLDLDDFHEVNEQLGREGGDQVLVELAARLQSGLRGTDFTARLDGDEFAIVCEDLTDPDSLAMLLRRIRDALAAPVHVGEAVIEVRATIGSAVSAGADQPGVLLNLADRSMSAARRTRQRQEIGAAQGGRATP
jgi:diguanylate cyclase (GGDEF)-like protein